jgi:hypothetical protein
MPLLSGAPYALTFLGVPGGLPSTALGARSAADATAACAQATADIDSLAFRGRYGDGFIFASVGADVALRCVQRARWLFLGGQRGFDPQADADKQIVDGNTDFLAWCDRVHRRAEFPDVTIYVAPQYQPQPAVMSQPSRGWHGRETF